MVGAWPKGTGDRTNLLHGALDEHASSGVSMLVMARDTRTANWYLDNEGERVNPDHELHIAWINNADAPAQNR